MILTLGKRTRSRILIGTLCLLFLMCSIRVASKSCNAAVMEKGDNNHFHIAPGVNWNHSSMPSTPSENCCSYSSSASSCCMCAIKNTPKNSHASLLYRDTLRQLSTLQPDMIRPSAHVLLSQKDRCFHDFNSFHQKEFFLVNCTFLI